jgi:transposase
VRTVGAVRSCAARGCIPRRCLSGAACDAGVLAGKKAGESIGKLSADQAENAHLRRQLEVNESRLQKTEAALELMGKLQAFLESASEDMPDGHRSKKR